MCGSQRKKSYQIAIQDEELMAAALYQEKPLNFDGFSDTICTPFCTCEQDLVRGGLQL